jgi:hypothetical protein
MIEAIFWASALSGPVAFCIALRAVQRELRALRATVISQAEILLLIRERLDRRMSLAVQREFLERLKGAIDGIELDGEFFGRDEVEGLIARVRERIEEGARLC